MGQRLRPVSQLAEPLFHLCRKPGSKLQGQTPRRFTYAVSQLQDPSTWPHRFTFAVGFGTHRFTYTVGHAPSSRDQDPAVSPKQRANLQSPRTKTHLVIFAVSRPGPTVSPMWCHTFQAPGPGTLPFHVYDEPASKIQIAEPVSRLQRARSRPAVSPMWWARPEAPRHSRFTYTVSSQPPKSGSTISLSQCLPSQYSLTTKDPTPNLHFTFTVS